MCAAILLDVIVAEEALQALPPAQLELALAELRELESRDHVIRQQWQMGLEQAEYEVALAERRYQEGDPSQFPSCGHTRTPLERCARSPR